MADHLITDLAALETLFGEVAPPSIAKETNSLHPLYARWIAQARFALLATHGLLLVTDANAAYRSFSRRHGVAHQYVNLQAGERVRRSSEGAIHVQNVNAYHRRLRDWLMRFHGVASRYLPNYLGWRRALDGGRVSSPDELLRLAIKPIHSKR